MGICTAQYRKVIGLFNSYRIHRVCCSIQVSVTSLFIFSWVMCVMLLLVSGDVHENPGPDNTRNKKCKHFRFAILILDHSLDQNCLQFKHLWKTCMMSSLYQKRICIRVSQMTLLSYRVFMTSFGKTELMVKEEGWLFMLEKTLHIRDFSILRWQVSKLFGFLSIL